jgi:hypothetical protein
MYSEGWRAIQHETSPDTAEAQHQRSISRLEHDPVLNMPGMALVSGRCPDMEDERQQPANWMNSADYIARCRDLLPAKRGWPSPA